MLPLDLLLAARLAIFTVYGLSRFLCDDLASDANVYQCRLRKHVGSVTRLHIGLHLHGLSSIMDMTRLARNTAPLHAFVPYQF